MLNIIIEIISFIIYFCVFFLVFNLTKKQKIQNEPGVKIILIGLGLLLFSHAIDITDNFPSLNHFLFIGDTIHQAFLEKTIGHALGGTFLFWGLKKWLPALTNLRNLKNNLYFSKKNLETEVNEYIEKLKYQADYDSLTSLLNRSAIKSILNKGKFDGYQAVFYIDLNDFKKINDNHGHLFGDYVLQSVSKKIKNTIKDMAVIPGRLGGDEFILIVNDLGENQDEAKAKLILLAEKITNEMDLCVELEGQDTYHRCSIGIVLYDKALSYEEVIKKSDLALYCAKSKKTNKGSSYELFSKEMESKEREKYNLIKDLKLSLSNGELFIHYQPQVDINRKIIGLEALLRWRHSKKGLISPDLFIPLAEKEGIIDVIGRYVLKESFNELTLFLKKNKIKKKLTLSVNISPIHFAQQDFVEQVKAVQKNTNINLNLELTENILIEEFDSVCKKIVELKNIGISVALDDFGKGYSSLRYIQKIPFSIIKVDRSFVNGIDDNINRIIIKAVVDMASHSSINVVAEGVETESQFNLLCGLGCKYYQGYLFYKPMPIKRIKIN